MAKRKREIDFIAAQKLLGKTNQSTSFEFILVVTVFVVACGMIGWYLMARKGYNDKAAELEEVKSQIDDLQATLIKQQKNFNEYEYVYDANGNPVILKTTVDANGNVKYVYKYSTINEVAQSVANELMAAQNASEEIKGTIDLISTIYKLVYYPADNLGCRVVSFRYAGNSSVTVNLASTSSEQKIAFLRYMEGSAGIVAGYDPTKYINNAKISNESSPSYDDNNVTTYTFTVTFSIISDVLPRNAE